MALIECPECGKMISDTAEKCVYCGYDFKNPNKKKVTITKKQIEEDIDKGNTDKWVFGIIGGIIAILLGAALFGILAVPEVRAAGVGAICVLVICGAIVIILGIFFTVFFIKKFKRKKENENK